MNLDNFSLKSFTDVTNKSKDIYDVSLFYPFTTNDEFINRYVFFDKNKIDEIKKRLNNKNKRGYNPYTGLEVLPLQPNKYLSICKQWEPIKMTKILGEKVSSGELPSLGKSYLQIVDEYKNKEKITYKVLDTRCSHTFLTTNPFRKRRTKCSKCLLKKNNNNKDFMFLRFYKKENKSVS